MMISIVFTSNFKIKARNFHELISLLMNYFFNQSSAFFVTMIDLLNIKDVQKDLKMNIEVFNFDYISN